MTNQIINSRMKSTKDSNKYNQPLISASFYSVAAFFSHIHLLKWSTWILSISLGNPHDTITGQTKGTKVIDFYEILGLQFKHTVIIKAEQI